MKEKYIRTIQETKGKFLHFRQDEVVLPSGKKTVRDMVLHPGAVAVVALSAQKEIIMVRQYRYPIGQISYEIPAGKLEQGEEPLATAQRELEEETGFKAAKWELLTSFYTAPGFANEIIHLYLAQGLQESQVNPDPDEIIAFETITREQAYAKMKSGEIKDAKTIIGLLWLEAMSDNGSLE